MSIDFDRAHELAHEIVNVVKDDENLHDILWALSMTFGDALETITCASCRRSLEKEARSMFDNAVKQSMAAADEQWPNTHKGCKNVEH